MELGSSVFLDSTSGGRQNLIFSDAAYRRFKAQRSATPEFSAPGQSPVHNIALTNVLRSGPIRAYC